MDIFPIFLTVYTYTHSQNYMKGITYIALISLLYISHTLHMPGTVYFYFQILTTCFSITEQDIINYLALICFTSHATGNATDLPNINKRLITQHIWWCANVKVRSILNLSCKAAKKLGHFCMVRLCPGDKIHGNNMHNSKEPTNTLNKN